MKNRSGTLSRSRALALWVIAVLIAAASLVSFAESYRALYDWAAQHGLHGRWALIWPLQVDVFIAVGELALFVGLAFAWDKRSRLGAWLVTLAGLVVSVAGNVGHVAGGTTASRITAAVPPIAAASALAVGLGVLKRVVENRAGDVAGEWPPDAPLGSPATHPGTVPSSSYAAAKAGLAATHAAGNPYSKNKLRAQFRISRTEADELWAPYEDSPAGAPEAPNLPAGDSGRDAPSPPRVPAAPNGRSHG